jgi:PhnB protein
LGAETKALLRFRDVKGADPTSPRADRVLHAALLVGNATFMLSDGIVDEVVEKANVAVALDFDDPADLQAKFDALAKTAQVEMPVHDTFYGGKMGVLTDAFGIRWMFNHGGS